MVGDACSTLRLEETAGELRITTISQAAGTTKMMDPKTHIKAPAAIWSLIGLNPKSLGV
jgi:hypothetical protein